MRAFRPGTDEKAWLEVNNRAFAGHPEQGGWDLEALSEREAEPWFDPAGFLCAWEGDRLVGSCWTKCHTDVRPVLGEIYVISVDPEDHHRGLGRALTVAGLDWLAGNGVGTAMLYVDAANTGALAMYGSLGFTEDHRRPRLCDRRAARTGPKRLTGPQPPEAPTARPMAKVALAATVATASWRRAERNRDRPVK